MAISDGIRITYKEDDVNAAGDTVQVIITQEDTITTGIDSRTADSENLFIHKYGQITWNYDFDDPLLGPQDFNIEIYDPDFFYDSMFDAGGSPEDYVRNMQCDVEINSAVVFRGYANEDDVTYDFTRKIFKVKFTSNLDGMTEKNLFDPEDTSTWFDPYGWGVLIGSASIIDFDDVLDTMFAEVESSGLSAIKILHRWDLTQNASVPPYEINLDTTAWPVGWWFNGFNPNKSETVGSLISSWAFDWGCMAGVWGLQPYFIQLWTAHSGNSQTISDLERLVDQYLFQKSEYLLFTASEILTPDQTQTRGDNEKAGVKSKTIERDIRPYFYASIGLGTNVYNRAGGPTYPASSKIHYSKDPRIYDTYVDKHTEQIADFYWVNRGGGGAESDSQYLRGDRFRSGRINIDPTKHFTFSGQDYFIIDLRINFEQSETLIQACICPPVIS